MQKRTLKATLAASALSLASLGSGCAIKHPDHWTPGDVFLFNVILIEATFFLFHMHHCSYQAPAVDFSIGSVADSVQFDGVRIRPKQSETSVAGDLNAYSVENGCVAFAMPKQNNMSPETSLPSLTGDVSPAWGTPKRIALHENTRLSACFGLNAVKTRGG